MLLELEVQSHPVRGENWGPRENNVFEEATHGRREKEKYTGVSFSLPFRSPASVSV